MIDPEQLLSEDYQVWKDHAPALYDLLTTSVLEWPSMTIDWVPGRTFDRDTSVSTQRLVLGTHSHDEGALRHLLLVEGQFFHPVPLKVVHERQQKQAEAIAAANDQHNAEGSSDPHAGVVRPGAVGTSPMRRARFMRRAAPQAPQPPPTAIADPPPQTSTFRQVRKLKHKGDVHRARVMPQRGHIVATKSSGAAGYVFDIRDDNPIAPRGGSDGDAILKLKGHRRDGFGLEWSPLREGMLASASEDGLICIWDIQSSGALERGLIELPTIQVLTGHQDGVRDVSWSPVHYSVLASVGIDKTLRMWDMRVNDKCMECVEERAHDVNGVAFNPASQYLIATGGGDGTVALWDMRKMKKGRPLHRIFGHTGDVFGVSWCPNSETTFASWGADRRVMVWDISRIGMPQPAEDVGDGPPELIFIHMGHTGRVSDASWNKNPDDPWTMASTAEDNIWQSWQIAEPPDNDYGADIL